MFGQTVSFTFSISLNCLEIPFYFHHIQAAVLLPSQLFADSCDIILLHFCNFCIFVVMNDEKIYKKEIKMK